MLLRHVRRHVFKTLVPDLAGKTVVDVGSRLGAVLYGVGCGLFVASMLQLLVLLFFFFSSLYFDNIYYRRRASFFFCLC